MKRLVFYCIFLFGMAFSLNAVPSLVDNFSQTKNIEISHQYKIIMDAGSSGTRIYLYKNLESNSLMVPNLAEIIYKREKVPLASLSNNESGVNNLMTKLLSYIDTENYPDKSDVLLHKKTIQVTLLATAGMRKLTDAAQQYIYNSAKKSIASNGYMVGEARTLQGYEEAIFTWSSLNYLKNKFQLPTTASLEVGGSSMQIVYELPPSMSVSNIAQNVKNVTIGDKVYRVFSYSWLGLGDNDIRHSLVKESSIGKNFCFVESYIDPLNNIYGHYNYTKCREAYTNIINTFKPDIKSVAINYKGNWNGVSSPAYILNDFAISATPKELVHKLQTVCIKNYNELVLEPWYKTNPLLCTNGTYIDSLLNVLNINQPKDLNDKFQAVLKIDNKEINWTMGYFLIKAIR